MEIKRYIALVILVLSKPLAAADHTTAPEWATLLTLSQTSSFNYQETRQLEFFEQDWQGAGILIASQDGTLVKHQLRPQRKILAITPSEMIYFDSSNAERHRMQLSFKHPMSKQALMFQSLLLGKTEKFSQDYTANFTSNAEAWTLKLLPKKQTTASLYTSITLQGNSTSGSRTMILHEASGDSSTLTMQLLEKNKALEFTIQRLLQEAIGN